MYVQIQTLRFLTLITSDVYTAATVLLAARLQPIPNADDISYSVAESWDYAIQILKSFERLGQSAQRCVAALEILSAKMPNGDLSGSKTVPGPPHRPGLELDSAQTFPATNLGEYGEDFNFGDIEIDLSDMSWLNILPGDLY